MALQSYTGLVSLDGFINDASGDFDWAFPSPEVHQLANDLDRSVGTHLYGRKLYETMVAWETMPPGDPIADDYADLWKSADKVVFSRTLGSVASARTTLLRDFSPAWVAELTASAGRNIAIGGPTLAAQVFDLIDDINLFVFPVIVGNGTRFLPPDATANLTLVDTRAFDDGVVYTHYRKDA